MSSTIKWICSDCESENEYYPPLEDAKRDEESTYLLEMFRKEPISREVIVTCPSCHTKGKIVVKVYER